MQTSLRSAAMACSLALALPVFAAGEHRHGPAPGASPARSQPGKTALSDGVVKKVDKAAAKVTLAHGPLLNIGMTTPMTMVFRVKDSAWLDQMKEGDKIRFLADSVNGAITVVHFEPAK